MEAVAVVAATVMGKSGGATAAGPPIINMGPVARDIEFGAAGPLIGCTAPVAQGAEFGAAGSLVSVVTVSPRAYKHRYNIDTLNILNMKHTKCKVLHTCGGGDCGGDCGGGGENGSDGKRGGEGGDGGGES